MRFRWECGSTAMAAILAVYMATFLNLSFWRYAWLNLDIEGVRGWLFVLSLPLAYVLAAFILFSLLLWSYVGKAITAVLLVAAAAANYFMFRLNVFIDREMLRNVLATNMGEAFEMVTTEGVLWIVGFGIVPAVLLLFTRIRYRRPARETLWRIGCVAASLVVMVGIGLPLYKEYSAAARNHKLVRKIMNPSSYIAAMVSFTKKRLRAGQEFMVIDEDPNHVPYEDPYVTVLILMIGETARAMSFSLNGYERETNPKLSRQDIVNFGNVTSSGTATAFSLPCMFSHLPRAKFDIERAETSENLLDVMQKAGYDVIWFENDGGSKGVSDRVTTVDLWETGNPKYRIGDTFYDEVLLDGLEERLAAVDKDTVIVLHMMGSHGPSYYRRYPDAFKHFLPTADTAEIQSRPREEIVNTYDNTILYTDHVVSGTIDILKKFPNFEAGLLFVSDHGESLGENGLYLHGFPYAFAPREQTHVPMVLWMSETMQREDHVDYEKLRAAAGDMELSHDHLFHSVLGLVEIDTELYDRELDLFWDFRTKKLPYAPE